MIITKQENFDKVKDIFSYIQITKHIYITRLYGSKELHPIGYHIPILVITY